MSFNRPALVLGVLMLAQIVVWTLAPTLTHSAPTLDTVEGYVWGREHVIATYKHPNLPGLILEAGRQVTGQVGWPAYFTSQLFVSATLATVYMLGCELLGAQAALAGTLLLTGVYFFSWPTIEFNHNVAQMPFWALTTLTLWRATSQGKFRHWLLLGLFGGLSIWAKYSSAVMLLFAALWILSEVQGRKSLRTIGPWTALVIFFAMVSPQLVWLNENHFAPFRYAAERASESKWYSQIMFLLNMLLDHLPMLAMLVFAGLVGKSRAGEDGGKSAMSREKRFLLHMGLGPVLLTFVVGLLTHADLKTAWAAPMFNLSGLLAVSLLGGTVTQQNLRRLTLAAAVLLVIVPSLYAAHVAVGANFSHRIVRPNWPQAEISHQLNSAWRHATDAPLRIVAGDVWTAGLVGLETSSPPSVLIDGNFDTSPWITPQRLDLEGALLVWRSDHPIPKHLAEMTAALRVRELQFPLPQFSNVAPLALKFAIVPPKNASVEALEK
jgi:4-amino-4-deoxy-L-arabinose transferase-like glycosyltransferase